MNTLSSLESICSGGDLVEELTGAWPSLESTKLICWLRGAATGLRAFRSIPAAQDLDDLADLVLLRMFMR